MKLQHIIDFLESIAPLSSQESWDNSGLLTGSAEQEITKVLLALDITTEVVKEAADKSCELIISHHPVIFDPLRSIEPDSAAALLVRNGIAALCLHTNLDKAQNGVNTALADALELDDPVLYPEQFMCIGTLSSPMSAEDFALYVREKLSSPDVRFTNTDHMIRNAAVSSGGGGEGVALCEEFAFDAFVTGELKHHQFIYAKEHRLCAVDAGHFSTEDVVTEPLKRTLQEQFPDVAFIKSASCSCPYDAV